MILEDLVSVTSSPITKKEISILKKYCWDFICESRGRPLYKALSGEYSCVDKVKVRIKKTDDLFESAFNKAFDSEYRNLFQRAVFSHTTPPAIAESKEDKLYYVFPINGYNYMYSKNGLTISDYHSLIEQEFGDSINTNVTEKLFSEEFVVNSNLYEGISTSDEIIFYGINRFYTVDCASVENYDDLVAQIQFSY